MVLSDDPTLTIASLLLVVISIAWMTATRQLFRDDDKDLWKRPPQAASLTGSRKSGPGWEKPGWKKPG